MQIFNRRPYRNFLSEYSLQIRANSNYKLLSIFSNFFGQS